MAKYIKTEEGYKTIESIENAATMDIADTVNRKMDAANPVGTGSFSMNRKVGSSIGSYSHAEGYNTEASGYSSHAEGYDTGSYGSYSHAEGYSTRSYGYYSHAEGYSTRSYGYYSHAEGYDTGSYGSYSHAEGYATLASSGYQHVQGKYNVEDTKGSYAHIVGNGASNTARSNAHTIDWEGNVWFAGDIRVGGRSYSDSSAKVIATQEYVDAVKTTADSAKSIAETAQTTANNAMPKTGGDFTGDVNFSVGGKKVWISFTDENGNATTDPYIHWEE